MHSDTTEQALEGSLAPSSDDRSDGSSSASTPHVRFGTPPGLSLQGPEAPDDNDDEYLSRRSVNEEAIFCELEEDEAEVGAHRRHHEMPKQRDVRLSQQEVEKILLKNLIDDDILDEVDEDEARQIASQIAAVTNKHAAWSAVPANVAAAEQAYQTILDNLNAKIAELENDGIEVRLGPLPPATACPLTAKLLDVLHWPHDKVSQDLGFLDPTIATYHNLSKFRFFEILRGGEGSVIELHWCQAHSSDPKSPTFPRNGAFPCHERIRELCSWLWETIYLARFRLRVPGLIVSYGVHTNDAVKAVRRKDKDTESTEFIRVIQREKHDVGVAPRIMGFALTSPKSDPENVFSVSWDCNHPSAGAYALKFGRSLSGRSCALSLDRALTERLLVAGLPPPDDQHFFANVSRAGHKRQRDTQKIQEIEKTIVVNPTREQIIERAQTLYVEEKRERERIRITDGDAAAEQWDGYDASVVSTRVGRSGGLSVAGWTESYEKRFLEFGVIPAFRQVPLARTILEKALWYLRWNDQLRRFTPVTLNADEAPWLIITSVGSTAPLANRFSSLAIDKMQRRSNQPRPLRASEAGWIATQSTSSTLPLAVPGQEHMAAARMQDVAVRPVPADEAEHLALTSAPYGYPLGAAGAGRQADIMIDSRDAQTWILEATEAAHVIGSSSPLTFPLAMPFADRQTLSRMRTNAASARPLDEFRTRFFSTLHPSTYPLSLPAPVVNRIESHLTKTASTVPVPADEAGHLVMSSTSNTLVLARSLESSSADKRVESKKEARPLPADEAGHLIACSFGNTLPFAVPGTQKLFKGKGVMRLIKTDKQLAGIRRADTGKARPQTSAALKARKTKGVPMMQVSDQSLNDLRKKTRDQFRDEIDRLSLANIFDFAVKLGFTKSPDGKGGREAVHARWRPFTKTRTGSWGQGWRKDVKKGEVVTVFLDFVFDPAIGSKASGSKSKHGDDSDEEEEAVDVSEEEEEAVESGASDDGGDEWEDVSDDDDDDDA